MTKPKPPAPPTGAIWKPGERAEGTGEVGKLREAIKGHVPAIIERLTAQALDGDVQAARLL